MPKNVAASETGAGPAPLPDKGATLSVIASLQEVIERGQRLLVHRLELMRYELTDDLAKTLQVTLARAVAVVVALIALFFALLALYQYLATWMMPPLAALAMSGITGASAAALWLAPQWWAAAQGQAAGQPANSDRTV